MGLSNQENQEAARVVTKANILGWGLTDTLLFFILLKLEEIYRDLPESERKEPDES